MDTKLDDFLLLSETEKEWREKEWEEKRKELFEAMMKRIRNEFKEEIKREEK